MHKCIINDTLTLLWHVSKLPVWERPGTPEMVRIGRERLAARRKKEIERLGRQIHQSLKKMWAH